MRKVVAALLVAILIAFGIAAYRASSSFERRAAAAVENIQREVSERRYELQVGKVRSSWFPRPKVVLEKVTVTNGARGGNLVVAQVERAVVIPRGASLFAAPEEIERLELEDAKFITRVATYESVVVLLPIARAVAVPVQLRNSVIRVERGPALPAIDLSKIDVTLVPKDGALEFSGTVAPLGERSNGKLEGVWRPGAGRTGGDGVKLDLEVRGGDPAALAVYVPQLGRAHFTDEVSLDLHAEGFLGERTTEALPAEPLTGRVHGEVGLDILGFDRHAVFDSRIALDDRRWALSEGEGKWGERPFTFAGWVARGYGDNKANLRLGFTDVSVPGVLADYGIPEKWRPEATVTGEIRLGGSFDYTLTRFEAKAPTVTFNGFEKVPMSSGPMQVTGTLLAVNADVSGSFTTDELRIAHLKIPNVLAGARWWRDKLTVTSLGLPLWGGKLDGSAAYEPAEAEYYKGGGLLRDVDAAVAVAQLFPGSGLQLGGKLDASVNTGMRDGRLWYHGRVGVHEGKLGPKGLLRSILEEVVVNAGAQAATVAELAERHPVLAADALPFRRIAADFQSAAEGIDLRVADLVSDGATLWLDGTVRANQELRADGVATFASALTSDLVRRVAALGKLVDPEGELQVPVRVEGPPGDLHTAVDARFTTELLKARDGKKVDAFIATTPEPSFTVDLPPLEEQFGR